MSPKIIKPIFPQKKMSQRRANVANAVSEAETWRNREKKCWTCSGVYFPHCDSLTQVTNTHGVTSKRFGEIHADTRKIVGFSEPIGHFSTQVMIRHQLVFYSTGQSLVDFFIVQ